MRKGQVTVPTDVDVIDATIDIIKRFKADAIRDCDGTNMPDALKKLDVKRYATYYTTRKDNPLKGMQAMIAVSCKVIRIFYALLTHGMDYSSTRFRADIIRPEPAKAA